MKFKKDQKVNVEFDIAKFKKLGIDKVSNPCTVTGFYENGTDGYYLRDAEGKTKAIPKSADLLTEAN